MHLMKYAGGRDNQEQSVALGHQVCVSERSRLVNGTVSHTWEKIARVQRLLESLCY